jgi:hypothetical protein
MLPGYDPHLQLGIFGDAYSDKFPLQISQYEFAADKFVELMKEFVPEREGGDHPEDPQYGLFAAAYLTQRYTNKIGLKGYHFMVSDATAHDVIESSVLRKLFGEDVFALTAENGYEVSPPALPSVGDVVRDLQKSTHAFFLQVSDSDATTGYWREAYGRSHIVSLGDTEYLPHVIAAIVGLTEGTLHLDSLENFLKESNLTNSGAISRIIKSLAGIPLGAQALLRDNLPKPIPVKGDIFKNKTDAWPTEEGAGENNDENPNKTDWL